MGNLKDNMGILKELEGKELSGYDLMASILNGDRSDIEIASILTFLSSNILTVNDFVGFRNAIMDVSHKVNLNEFRTLDICGTGGDGKNTFNISTTAAFILAAGGVKVTKHGNYGSSSICGSSNVLEWLGYEFSNDEDVLKGELYKCGITFLHAPLFHPHLKKVSEVRRVLGSNTIFNALGPVCNPSKPNISVVGVSMANKRYFDYYKEVLNTYAIIEDQNGYDEISLTDSVRIHTNNGYHYLFPINMWLNNVNGNDIIGGATVEESGKQMVRILNRGGSEAENDVVAANAGLGFMLYDGVELVDGIRKAKEILKSGAGLDVLHKLVG